jgi:CheY-like chemotaxis protein
MSENENQLPLNMELAEDYEQLVKSIKQSFDPNSNSVLLVDDERGIRVRVARDIRAFDPGIVIFEAGNGREGLQKLAEIRARFRRDPLFIVLDLNMPVMDGWEFIATLRKEYAEAGRDHGIPIIVLSSTSGEKGLLFTRKTVHDGKSRYSPLVTVAKEICADPSRYDAAGEKGLLSWVRHFAKQKG